VRFTGIDHVVFRVRDPEASAAWWHRTFGLEAERLDEWRRGEVPFVSVRVSGSAIIDLVAGERPGGVVDNVDHVAFEVTDVDLDDLAAEGALDVEWGPRDLFGARGTGRGLYVRDPDGNRIELRSYPSR
jgi:catechol 2,3-dioxygenase-like lactoylglutathione lyase family enzyme